MTTALKIDFVSDVSCPWCVIGLKALDQALAFKRRGDDGGVPMPAVARQFEVVADQAGSNDGVKFFAGHKVNRWSF